MLTISFNDVQCVLLFALALTWFYTAAVEEAIFHGKSEVLKSPGLARRKVASLDKCAKACLDEKTIKCHFFKFVNSSQDCFLSENDNKDVREFIDKVTQSSAFGGVPVKLKEVEEMKDVKSSRENTAVKDQEIVKIEKELKQLKKSAKKLKSLDKKISNSKKYYKQKKTDVIKLKKQNNREEKAIISLQTRIHLLAEQLETLKSEMSNIQQEQKSYLAMTKSMKSSDVSIAEDVRKLLTHENDVKKNAAQFNSFNQTVQQDLKTISANTKNLEERFETLLKEIKEGKYKKKMSKKLQTDQVKLAKLLAKVSSRDKSLKSKANKLQNNLVKLVNSYRKQTSKNNAVMESINKLKETLQNLKKNIDEEADPMSKKNRKWQTDVKVVKSDVSRLTETNSQLNEDMKSNQNNLANIIKDLTNVQLGIKNIKSKFGKEKTNYELLKQKVNGLIKEEAKLPTIIEMTKMSSTILKALSALEDKELDAEEKVDGFRGNLKELSTKISNNEKVADNFKKIMQKRQKQHKYLIDTIRQNEEKLLIVAKHIVPKKNIVAIENRAQKVADNLAKTRKDVKSLKQELKAVNESVAAEVDKHLGSKLQNVYSSFSKTVKSLRSKVNTAHQEISKLLNKVKSLQHRHKDLSKEMKEQKENTAVILKKTKDEKEKSEPQKGPDHPGSSKKKSHGHKKKPKEKTPVKEREKRSHTDSSLSKRQHPHNAGGNIFSTKEHLNEAAGGRRCPQGYDLHGVNCYKFINLHLSYENAKETCVKNNGSIIVINSHTKQAELTHVAKRNKVAASKGLWISAMYYDSRTQQFLWDASHTEVLFNNYSSSFNNKQNPQGKRCNIFHINMNGVWIGYPCGENGHSAERFPTVCETRAN